MAYKAVAAYLNSISTREQAVLASAPRPLEVRGKESGFRVYGQANRFIIYDTVVLLR